jgi:hypothetical protein
MRPAQKKLAFLAVFYAIALLTDACFPICDCPDVRFPFFDYKKLAIETNDPRQEGTLAVKITPDSTVFLAQASPRFHLISAAYGCSCNENGDMGDKYAPMAIDVFADRPFNDTLPAGASLRSIFWGGTGGDIIAPLSESFRPNKFNSVGNEYSIYTSERPSDTSGPFHFRIQWVKANGDTLNATTDAVSF